MELHPDRGGDPAAFGELTRAYHQLAAGPPRSVTAHAEPAAPCEGDARGAPAHVIATYVALAVAIVVGLRSLVAFDLDRMVLGFQLAAAAGVVTLAVVWWVRARVSR